MKFRFGDSLGVSLLTADSEIPKRCPRNGLNVVHALWNLKLWRQQSRRQGENGRLLLLDGFRHPSEKSEFITTHKIIYPERRKGREWSERGEMNSHLELVSSQQPSPLSNPRYNPHPWYER